MKQEIIRIDLGGVNCYLGKQGENFILFDTGGHMFLDKQFDNRRQALEKALNSYGCNTTNLKLIMLTHGDNDHAANAVYLRTKYHAKIAMHAADFALVDCPSMEKLMENCHYHAPSYKLMFIVMNRLIRKISQKALDDFESFKPDIAVDDGFDLSPYGFEANVIAIPGHTKGSIGILTHDGDLISGDTFANMSKPEIAPNAYDFKVLRHSIKGLDSMNIKTVYPGHGAPFSFSVLRK